MPNSSALFPPNVHQITGIPLSIESFKLLILVEKDDKLGIVSPETNIWESLS